MGADVKRGTEVHWTKSCVPAAAGTRTSGSGKGRSNQRCNKTINGRIGKRMTIRNIGQLRAQETLGGLSQCRMSNAIPETRPSA